MKSSDKLKMENYGFEMGLRQMGWTINPEGISKFGDALRKLRKVRGLTQANLARLLNISEAHIGLIEREKRGAPRDIKNLNRLATGLQLRPVEYRWLCRTIPPSNKLLPEYLDPLTVYITLDEMVITDRMLEDPHYRIVY